MENFSEAIEDREDSGLAPYAIRHRDSGGRIFPEADQPYRTCFQRDRDRIIHSKAFRRLGYKTQVFINSEGDNYRTRLTHSLEVGQIARSVSSVLRLNVDFAETLALAHDLGHTPFGHAGQDSLHSLMNHHGGFEHNRQSLRIVSVLESRYPDYNGLNLSRATLKGMMKHKQTYECDLLLKDLCNKRREENPCLEAEIVDQCDKIAYNHHDLEDGLDSGFLAYDELDQLPFWKHSRLQVLDEKGEIFKNLRREVQIRTVIRKMMDACITDLIETTQKNLNEINPASLNDILSLERSSYPVAFSREMQEILKETQNFLRTRLYNHPRVMQMSRRGIRMIEFLFDEYIHNPEIMPVHVQKRINDFGLHRVVSDYISGMTDRYAMKQYEYLSGHGNPSFSQL
ncbi:MAG: deoxyguanosinetriphosphate triphosphohydrolase [Spirochaetia bacterium]|nr:deoxyguanosinetriphosphate triphosphohydrolase [Spirochaetia bacterium]